MMTPMILFRGSYSQAIEPDVHYIPLEKDFSNADAILARLDDLEYLQGLPIAPMSGWSSRAIMAIDPSRGISKTQSSRSIRAYRSGLGGVSVSDRAQSLRSQELV